MHEETRNRVGGKAVWELQGLERVRRLRVEILLGHVKGFCAKLLEQDYFCTYKTSKQVSMRTTNLCYEDFNKYSTWAFGQIITVLCYTLNTENVL